MYFKAFDANTGKVLYSHAVADGLRGVVTYRVGGNQYIAVVSGYIGSYNDFAPELGGDNPTITIFGLK